MLHADKVKKVTSKQDTSLLRSRFCMETKTIYSVNTHRSAASKAKAPKQGAVQRDNPTRPTAGAHPALLWLVLPRLVSPAPHQRAGEDLRDDPVQIVKEGRPLPQDAAP